MSLLATFLFGLGALFATAETLSIALPKPDRSGRATLERVLQSRRSVRNFDRAPIALADLGQLLWAAQGITSEEGHRTAPSAGALYPLELIVVATHVEGLEPGIYRYVPAQHALHPVVAGTFANALAAAALGQESVGEAAAVIVVAGVEERTSTKYASRAPRYVAIEAGCTAQNFLLETSSLGLGSVVVGAFNDRDVARVAHLERGESPLLLLPVGIPRG